MLRDVSIDDLPIFFEHQSDPEACHVAAFVREDPSNRQAFDQHWQKILENPSIVKKTIEHDDGAIVGHIIQFEMFGKPEITYWVGREHWGKGIASRALKEFLQIVTLRPLFARAAFDNLGSAKVLERCGFEKVDESAFLANARGKEIKELIWRLKND